MIPADNIEDLSAGQQTWNVHESLEQRNRGILSFIKAAIIRAIAEDVVPQSQSPYPESWTMSTTSRLSCAGNDAAPPTD